MSDNEPAANPYPSIHPPETVERLHARTLDQHGMVIASFAWEQYMRRGRGVVVLDLKGRPQMVPVSAYSTAADLAPNMHRLEHADEVARWLAEYSPADEAVLFWRNPDETLTVQRWLPEGPPVSAFRRLHPDAPAMRFHDDSAD